MENPTLLDIIHLYRHPSEFISPLERLCNTWTSKTETKGMYYVGYILIFVVIYFTIFYFYFYFFSFLEFLIQDYENFGAIFLLLISTIDRYEVRKIKKNYF